MPQRRETVLQRTMRMREGHREWSRRKRAGLPTRGLFAGYPDGPPAAEPTAAKRPAPGTTAWLEQVVGRADVPKRAQEVATRALHRREWVRKYRRRKRRERAET